MTDPVYIYRGHGRNAIYARPEGTDRKVSCLPGSRVHMSGAEIAAYDDQPLVSFEPVAPPVEPPKEPPAEKRVTLEWNKPPASKLDDMSRSDLWAAIKSRGLHEEFDLDYRSTDSDEMREILSAFTEE